MTPASVTSRDSDSEVTVSGFLSGRGETEREPCAESPTSVSIFNWGRVKHFSGRPPARQPVRGAAAAAAALLKPHSLSIAHYLGPSGPTRIATGPMETAEQQARHDSSLARLIGQVPVVPSATASAPPP
ncbi:hypothetical protein CCHR01_07771 [Colletotrichum chrysophilum]|uniref:Uncharacterized protein n=1 Tax=Colletotrichum chrysophilum TaxID=1836956 RepID=A0AAD9AMJ7_9PEZI|nr:hypothetical protein CCHR01_07771 [Colletotrichum chrysophilum]